MPQDVPVAGFPSPALWAIVPGNLFEPDPLRMAKFGLALSGGGFRATLL